jgi:hypothetical protein
MESSNVKKFTDGKIISIESLILNNSVSLARLEEFKLESITKSNFVQNNIEELQKLTGKLAA